MNSFSKTRSDVEQSKRERIDPNQAKIFGAQKRRLAYLLSRYCPPSLKGLDLSRRLRLPGAFIEGSYPTEKEYDQNIRDSGKRVLRRPLRFLTHDAFEKWTILPGQKGEVPTRGLPRELCDALGFVIADESGFWPLGSAKADSAEAAAIAEIFDVKVRDLASFIETGLSQPAAIFHNLKSAQFDEFNFETVSARASQEQSKKFLQGRETPWIGFVNSGSTIERDIESSVLTSIERGEERAILITSAAGDGKSTLLYRLARQLFNKGSRVIFRHARNHVPDFSFNTAIRNSAKTVIFVDRAEYIKDIKTIARFCEENSNTVILLSAREMDWIRVHKFIDTNIFSHFSINRLSESEIERLASLISDFDAAEEGAQIKDIRSRILKSNTSGDFPHMLAAMMTACSGKDFSSIIKSFVENFKYKEILKATAICSQFGEKGKETYCTTSIFSALLIDDQSHQLDKGRANFNNLYNSIKSEIIRISGDRYELRHPDIAKMAISQLYDTNDVFVLRKTEELLDDLYRIMRAIIRVRVLDQDTKTNRLVPSHYMYDIPRFWWQSHTVGGHQLGRRLFESIIDLLGFPHVDKSVKAGLISSWLDLEEKSANNDSERDEIFEKYYPLLVQLWSDQLDKLIGCNSSEEANARKSLENAYDRWCTFAVRAHGVGDFHEPELGSLRFVFRLKWHSHRGLFQKASTVSRLRVLDTTDEGLGARVAPALFTIRWLYRELWQSEDHSKKVAAAQNWAQLEQSRDNFGSKVDPGEFSARWIYQTAWTDKSWSAHLAIQWAQMEAGVQNLGRKVDPEKFTARWICQQAWDDPKLRSAQLAIQWAQMEADAESDEKNFGSKVDPEEFSARWIYQTAWTDELRSAQLAIQWAQMEAGDQNLGRKVDPEKFTARWICQQAWDDPKLRSAQLAIQWAQMEAGDQNLGRKVDPEEFSARWIYREAKTHGLQSSEMMRHWAQMEAESQNLGRKDKPEEFSARWMYRELATGKDLRTIARLWAKTEFEDGNIGEYIQLHKYSARWLYVTCLNEKYLDEDLKNDWFYNEMSLDNLGEDSGDTFGTAWWIIKSVFTKQEKSYKTAMAYLQGCIGNLGNFVDPEPGTARYLFRKAFRETGATSSYWAKLEIEAPDANINYGRDFSANWIFQEYKKKFGDEYDKLESWLATSKRASRSK
ncbi:AAA domain containing protein [Rhabdaerophilaceae bacterium]